MRRITTSVLAVAAAMLAAGPPAMAVSCNGNGHDITLSNGTATPGTGTTSTAVRFSIRYADTAGCAPSRVEVVVQGVGTYPLSGSGSNYATGVTFSRTISLPAGGHPYAFRATSGKKSATLSNVSPSKVVITAPTPRPTATPAPPPPPTAQPAPPAPAPPAPAPPAPPASSPTAAPTATVKPTPTAKAASKSPDDSPTAPGAASPSGTAIDGWWPAIQARTELGEPAEPATTQRPASAFEFVPELPPSPDDLASLGVVAAFGITTAGGLALFFILLRTRRDDGSASPPPLAAAIPPTRASALASPLESQAPAPPSAAPLDSGGAANTPRVSPLPPMRELIPPIDYDLLRDPDERVGPAAHEAGIPRWLRPSVRVGRFGEEQRRRRDWGD
jgi:hypothetical protein